MPVSYYQLFFDANQLADTFFDWKKPVINSVVLGPIDIERK